MSGKLTVKELKKKLEGLKDNDEVSIAFDFNLPRTKLEKYSAKELLDELKDEFSVDSVANGDDGLVLKTLIEPDDVDLDDWSAPAPVKTETVTKEVVREITVTINADASVPVKVEDKTKNMK